MYTIKEVADRLRVSPRTVQRFLTNRKLASVRVGGQWRIPHTALEEYLARNASEAL